MANSSAFSTLLNFSNSKIRESDVRFSKIRFLVKKNPSFPRFRSNKFPISIADNYPPSSGSCNSTTITNSLAIDYGSVNDKELKRAELKLGSKVRVKVPLQVYHVPKLPEFDLTDKIGVLKQFVGIHKGKRISANLPYKVEFEAEEISGRDGKLVKFTAHLKEDEFEFLE